MLASVAMLVALVLPLVTRPILFWSREENNTFSGTVIALDGTPIGGATVSDGDRQATTNGAGQFIIPTRSRSSWVTVTHPAYLSRTRAAASDRPVLIRLTPDDGETLSITFAGDTMFGRRFYDPNEDGDTSDGLLQPGDGMEEHLALLQDVRPLIENADLTVVNLETPLSDEPYFDPTQSRPARFHPTKDFAFASDPAAAAALREAGVDIVDLGNNHLYDVLDQGTTQTLAALDQAGVGHFGAELTVDAAWQPAEVTIAGSSVAFLGCTTITGAEHPISYVAGPGKAGAASCDEDTIRDYVTTARATHDLVVFMLHGGNEYSRDPSDTVARLTDVARTAGATLVINHHPHVVGGFDWDGSSLVAWTLGNFLFDQTVWPTFESYVLTVHFRRGEVIRAYAEPLMVEEYRPTGLTGGLAGHVARQAAGRAPGPFVIEDGAVEIDVQGAAVPRETTIPIDAGSENGGIYRLDEGSWLTGFAGGGTARLGRDLLWVGSFEDDDVDAQTHEGALWDLEGDGKDLGGNYAFTGEVGVHLERHTLNERDVVLTPLHRILVEPGSDVSVVGMVRTNAGAGLSLQLEWYPDTRGASATRTMVSIGKVSRSDWVPFRVDLTVPPNTVAVGLFLRLAPPSGGTAFADIDDLRVVGWAPTGTAWSPLYDTIQIIGAGSATIREDALPGGDAWSMPQAPQLLATSPLMSSTPETAESGISIPRSYGLASLGELRAVRVLAQVLIPINAVAVPIVGGRSHARFRPRRRPLPSHDVARSLKRSRRSARRERSYHSQSLRE